jgi:hypothetical protein
MLCTKICSQPDQQATQNTLFNSRNTKAQEEEKNGRSGLRALRGTKRPLLTAFFPLLLSLPLSFLSPRVTFPKFFKSNPPLKMSMKYHLVPTPNVHEMQILMELTHSYLFDRRFVIL